MSFIGKDIKEKLKIVYIGDRKKCVSVQDVSHRGWPSWKRSDMLKTIFVTITLQQIVILT